MLSNILQTLDFQYDWFSDYYVYAMISLQVINVVMMLTNIVFNRTFINPTYIKRFNTSLQAVVCIVLIIKFNPFRTHIFRSNDARLITGSAVFILVNLSIGEYIVNNMMSLRKKVKFMTPSNEYKKDKQYENNRV